MKRGDEILKEKEKLTEKLIFRCTRSEREIINLKAEQAKYYHLSDYLRRQAVHGNVIQLNEKWYEDIMRQISGMANNLNQIARHFNETGTLHASDISDMKLIDFNLNLHLELIEGAVEKLYGNNKNQASVQDTV